MKAVLVKTKPNSHFHFGKYSPDSDTSLSHSDSIFHSDSLFSSLVINYNLLYDDTADFVKQFEYANIKVSSFNYFLQQEDRKVWFLPKPVIFNNTDVENYKTFKKIAFISKKLYQSINSPKDLLAEDVTIIQDVFALRKNELDIDEKMYSDLKVFNKLINQKVFVTKEEQGDDLYQLDVIEIADNTGINQNISIGFYFLIETTNYFDRVYGKKFQTTLEIIKSEGVGGEKSTIGQISEIEIEDNWEFSMINSDESLGMSLSMISPKTEVSKIIYAQTEFRGGRTLGAVDVDKDVDDSKRTRLKVVRMLKEGAIVHKDMKGYLANIAPDNWKGIPFLRNGKSFIIDINKKWLSDDTA